MVSKLFSIFFLIIVLNNKMYAQKTQKELYSSLLEKYGEKAVFYALLGEESLKKRVVKNLDYRYFNIEYYQLDVYKRQNWGKTNKDSNSLFKKFVHGGIYEKTSREQIDKIIKSGKNINIKKLSCFLSIHQDYIKLRQQLSERYNLVLNSVDFEVKIIQKDFPKLFRVYCDAIYYWYSDCTEEINGFGFNEIGITAIVNYLKKNKYLLKKLKGKKQ
ncbi:MAG: hypothetical protein SFU27_12185 [Thermonemataceae bacterium]|nr:hypothetical protein [Thermonemataceae bacterium]